MVDVGPNNQNKKHTKMKQDTITNNTMLIAITILFAAYIIKEEATMIILTGATIILIIITDFINEWRNTK